MSAEDRVIFSHVMGTFQRYRKQGSEWHHAINKSIETFRSLRPSASEREARQEVELLLGVHKS